MWESLVVELMQTNGTHATYKAAQNRRRFIKTEGEHALFAVNSEIESPELNEIRILSEFHIAGQNKSTQLRGQLRVNTGPGQAGTDASVAK